MEKSRNRTATRLPTSPVTPESTSTEFREEVGESPFSRFEKVTRSLFGLAREDVEKVKSEPEKKAKPTS